MDLKQDICSSWIENMEADEFASLQEDICYDRCCGLGADEVPDSPEALLQEPTIAKRGVYVTCLSCG